MTNTPQSILNETAPRGDVSKPQLGSLDNQYLQLGFLLLGAFEFIFGLMSYMAADYDLFIPVTFIAGGLGAVALLFCIVQPASVKVYDMLGASLMLAYGIGTLNTLFSFMADHSVSTLSYYVSEAWLTRTLGTCVASAGLLHMAGRLDTQGYLFKHAVLSESKLKNIFYFCLLFGLFVLAQIAKGSIGYMGMQNNDGSVQVSALTSLVMSFIVPVGCVAIYAGLNEVNTHRKNLFISFVLLLLGLHFFMGRQLFVFCAIIFLMMFIFVRRPPKFITIKNVIFITLLVFVIQVATTAFFTIRQASYSFKGHTKPKITELLPEAYRVYQDKGSEEIARRIKENVKTRTFLIEYLAMLTREEDKVGPLYGTDLARAFVTATPSAIYPNKYRSKFFDQEEGVANPHFNLTISDDANSIFTAGLIDFGMLGMFVLPLVTCIIFSLVMRLRNYDKAFISSTMIGVMVCQTMLSPEKDFIGYLTSLRDVVIVLLISLVCSYLVQLIKFKSKKGMVL